MSLAETMLLLVKWVGLHYHLLQLMCWVTVDAVLLRGAIEAVADIHNTSFRSRTHWGDERRCNFLIPYTIPLDVLKQWVNHNGRHCL